MTTLPETDDADCKTGIVSLDFDDDKGSLSDAASSIDNKVPHNSEPITLNVGGIKHQTTITTLSTSSDSVLFKMFEGNFSMKPSKDGSYFIDRDGTHFRHILNFLRDGKVNINDNLIITELLQEAQYYQIPTLVDKLSIKQVTSQIKSDILSEHHIEQILKYQMQKRKTFKVPHPWVLLTSFSACSNIKEQWSNTMKVIAKRM